MVSIEHIFHTILFFSVGGMVCPMGQTAVTRSFWTRQGLFWPYCTSFRLGGQSVQESNRRLLRIEHSFLTILVLFLVWAGHSKGQTGLVGLRAYFVCRSCAIVLGPPAFSSLARLSSAMDAMAGGRRKTTDCAGPGGLVLRVLCVFKTLFCQSFTCSL